MRNNAAGWLGGKQYRTLDQETFKVLPNQSIVQGKTRAVGGVGRRITKLGQCDYRKKLSLPAVCQVSGMHAHRRRENAKLRKNKHNK